MQKIAIHSVPRSGSTWLGNIINSHPNVSFKYQPLFSYAFKDYLNEFSSKEDINSFFELISTSDDDFINQKAGIEKGIIPVFKKSDLITHSCYKEVRYHHILENLLNQSPDLKLILLIRNPLSVLQSWYKAPKEFHTEQGWDFEQEWLDAPKKNLNKPEEFNGYNKWKEATTLFLKLNKEFPEQVIIITYNQLLSNTLKTVKQLFDFTNLKMESQTLKFIKNSQAKHHSDAYSVYKNKTVEDDWKHLPISIIDYINNDLMHTKLEKYLYE